MTYFTPVASRLRQYRAECSKHGLDWRAYRERYVTTPANRINASRTASQWGDETPNVCDRPFYADSFGVLGLRQCGTAEEVSRKEGSRRVEESGWYVDQECDETVSGYVLQLPARDGVPQYVAAVAWSGRDGVSIWPNRIAESALDAACWANDEARRIGESEREYQESRDLGRDWAGQRLKVLESRAERRRLVSAMREAERLAKASGVRIPALLANVHEVRLSSLLHESQRAWKKACDIISDNPYLDRDAFNEGVADSDGEVTSPYAGAA